MEKRKSPHYHTIPKKLKKLLGNGHCAPREILSSENETFLQREIEVVEVDLNGNHEQETKNKPSPKITLDQNGIIDENLEHSGILTNFSITYMIYIPYLYLLSMSKKLVR